MCGGSVLERRQSIIFGERKSGHKIFLLNKVNE
jgi:hypothetical protein